jgi:hypothetical protein
MPLSNIFYNAIIPAITSATVEISPKYSFKVNAVLAAEDFDEEEADADAPVAVESVAAWEFSVEVPARSSQCEFMKVLFLAYHYSSRLSLQL